MGQVENVRTVEAKKAQRGQGSCAPAHGETGSLTRTSRRWRWSSEHRFISSWRLSAVKPDFVHLLRAFAGRLEIRHYAALIQMVRAPTSEIAVVPRSQYVDFWNDVSSRSSFSGVTFSSTD